MAQREEESLIEDMRATIRADRERAAARVERRQPAPAPAESPAEPGKNKLRRLLGR